MLNNDSLNKLNSIFSRYDRKTIKDYVCWDCEKDLGDLNLDIEIKENLPLRNDGKFIVVCSTCGLLEESSDSDIN